MESCWPHKPEIACSIHASATMKKETCYCMSGKMCGFCVAKQPNYTKVDIDPECNNTGKAGVITVTVSLGIYVIAILVYLFHYQLRWI